MPSRGSGLDAQRLRHTRRVGQISLGEVAKLATNDLFRYAPHRGGDIVEQLSFLTIAHQPEQVTGLCVVVVAGAVVTVSRTWLMARSRSVGTPPGYAQRCIE